MLGDEYQLTFDGSLDGAPFPIRAKRWPTDHPWYMRTATAGVLGTSSPTVSTANTNIRPEFHVYAGYGGLDQPCSQKLEWRFPPSTDVDFTQYASWADAVLTSTFEVGKVYEIAPGEVKSDTINHDPRPYTRWMLARMWMEQPPHRPDFQSIEVVFFRRSERPEGIDYWVELDVRQAFCVPIRSYQMWDAWPETLDIEGRLKFHHFEAY